MIVAAPATTFLQPEPSLGAGLVGRVRDTREPMLQALTA
jgi:hypothetical protein